MITNNSACIYSLAMNNRFNMNSFESKYNKKFDCFYSFEKSYHFKRIFIDSELSTKFRFEKWIGGKFIQIELPIISYKDNSVKSFNLHLKAIILIDNVYREFTISLNDKANFPLKNGVWNQNYMLENALQNFDFHKDYIISMLDSNIFEHQNFNVCIKIYEENFHSDYWLP